MLSLFSLPFYFTFRAGIRNESALKVLPKAVLSGKLFKVVDSLVDSFCGRILLQ